MRTLRVGDVMTTRVVAITPATPFRDVVDLMLQHEISAVPVIDDEGCLVGLISEADLIGKQAYGGRRRLVLDGFSGLARREARELTRSRGRMAREIMTAPVETALVDDPLRAVARRMVENRLKHLAVVDDARRFVGIVSRRDLLRAFQRSDTEIAADIRGALSSSEHARGDIAITVTVDGGLVTLEGRVPRTDDVAGVCRLAWLVPGVVDVAHHLTVGTLQPDTQPPPRDGLGLTTNSQLAAVVDDTAASTAASRPGTAR
jgi:CBS domain-containing protein